MKTQLRKISYHSMMLFLAYVLVSFAQFSPGAGGLTLAQDRQHELVPLPFHPQNMQQYLAQFSSERSDKILVDTDKGRQILEYLKSALQTPSTTSCRKEQKSVISDSTWELIQTDLKKGNPSQGVDPIPLAARDVNPNGGINSTITFYGKGAYFPNGEVTTNFILRTRFYMDLQDPSKSLPVPPPVADAQKAEKSVKRSKATLDNGWLEIKIRNPSSSEVLGVNKYRIKVKDEDILALFNSNPSDPAFSKLISAIKEKVKEFPENNPAEVEALLNVVQYMGQLDPDFIRPQIVVSYERTAFKHLEPNYPLPKIQASSDLSSNPSRSNPASEMSVEYQITADENVVYYRPAIDPNDKSINLEKYYIQNSDLFLARYPNKATAIEFKDPFPVANFKDERSKTHQFFYDGMMSTIHDKKDIVPGFFPNKGKAGHFRMLKRKLQENPEILFNNDDSLFRPNGNGAIPSGPKRRPRSPSFESEKALPISIQRKRPYSSLAEPESESTSRLGPELELESESDSEESPAVKRIK